MAADPTVADLVDLLANASGPTLLAIIIIGAIREWWVPGKTHRRTIEERDHMMELLFRSTSTTDKALSVAKEE